MKNSPSDRVTPGLKTRPPKGLAGVMHFGAAPSDPNTWNIDTSHSTANFAVKHMLVSTVRGTLGPVKGRVTWDGKATSSVKADVVIDVSGISTDNTGRDTHLKSADFFDAANHPAITFKSTRVQPGAGGGAVVSADVKVTLDLELTRR